MSPVHITPDQRQKALRIYARALPLIADAVGLGTKALHNNVLRRVLFDDLAAIKSGEVSPEAEPVVPEIMVPSSDLGDATPMLRNSPIQDGQENEHEAGNSEPENITEIITAKPEKPKMQATGLKPMAIEPIVTGQCYLKNKITGAYLHFSGLTMTMEKSHRWKGTPAQAHACRDKFELARDLTMVGAINIPKS